MEEKEEKEEEEEEEKYTEEERSEAFPRDPKLRDEKTDNLSVIINMSYVFFPLVIVRKHKKAAFVLLVDVLHMLS